MLKRYPWEGKESPKETYVKSDSIPYVIFGLALALLGGWTHWFNWLFGLLFVAYGLGIT